MDKKIAGLLGAVGALGTMGVAQATPVQTDLMQANSYADLLNAVPNAVAALAADDDARASREGDGVKTAQISVEVGHHHHHHHHRRIIIRHHHHHHSQYMAIPRKEA